MSYGKVEEPSSSRSPYPNTARFAATCAIQTVTSSRSDRAQPSLTVNARPGWDVDLKYRKRRYPSERCEWLTRRMTENSFPSRFTSSQTHMAERELSAFIGAVTELFGREQARASAGSSISPPSPLPLS